MEGGAQVGQPGQSVGSNEQQIRPPMQPSQARFINFLCNLYEINDAT